MVFSRTFSVLARPHLLVLWLAQVFSAIGDKLFEIATVWLSVQLVGREAGIVLTASALARLLFGLIGGVLADRHDRQKLLVASDLIRFTAVISLPVAARYGDISLLHLALVATISGGLAALFDPTLQASLPALAPDSRSRQAFNGLLDVTSRLARIIGPGLAGFLIAVMPLPHFFTVDAVTFGLSALAVLSLGRRFSWRPAPEGRNAGMPSRRSGGVRLVLDDFGSAVKLIAAHRPLLWTFGSLIVFNMAWSAAFTVGVALLTDQVFEATIGTYGLIVAAYGVGNVVSNVVVGGLTINNRVSLFFLGKLVLGLGFVVVALAPSVPLALLGAAFAAVGGPMGDIMLLLIIQEDFPNNQIGKIYSARMTLASVGVSLGLAVAGPLYSFMSVREGILACALTTVVVSLVGLKFFYRQA